MNLTCVGISHHTAPLDVRERLWFSNDEIRRVLSHLQSQHAGEYVLFSTCNRTELYAMTEGDPLPAQTLKESLIDEKSAAASVHGTDLFSLTAGEAARHLFRVAAGIDSMIIGDVQILAQVKEGLGLAVEAGTAGIFMNRLFQLAFRAGKRARTETAIGTGAVSLSYAAVELAERLFENLQTKTALVIGAGETAELTATHLRSRNIGTLHIANRTESHAQQLAEKFGGMVVPFTRWHEMLTHVDIVIASVSGGELLLNASAFAVLQKRRANSLFIIDLGVPRNIDPKIGGRENVFLYDLDGLQTMVDETLDKRRLEIPKVEALIAEVLDELRQWYSSLEVNPTITALTQFMEHIRAEEVAAQINRFEPHDRELVELVTRRIINKIIHAPIVNLRNGRSTEAVDRRQKLLALQKLFGLAPSPKDDTDAE